MFNQKALNQFESFKNIRTRKTPTTADSEIPAICRALGRKSDSFNRGFMQVPAQGGKNGRRELVFVILHSVTQYTRRANSR